MLSTFRGKQLKSHDSGNCKSNYYVKWNVKMIFQNIKKSDVKFRPTLMVSQVEYKNYIADYKQTYC
jgi:hypothetical protein